MVGLLGRLFFSLRPGPAERVQRAGGGPGTPEVDLVEVDVMELPEEVVAEACRRDWLRPLLEVGR
jgi:hypothetical protein